MVSRPSRWGNWYVVGTLSDYRPKSLITVDAITVRMVDKRGHWTGAHWAGFDTRLDATVFAVDLFRRALDATYVDIDGGINRDFYLDGLRGHDLGCWCGPDDPCHADVLLVLANPGLILPSLIGPSAA